MQVPASDVRLLGAWRGVQGVAAVGWGALVFLLGTGLGTREEKARGLDGAQESPVGSRALPQDIPGLTFGQAPRPSLDLLPGWGPLLQSLGRGRPKAGEVDRARWVWHRAQGTVGKRVRPCAAYKHPQGGPGHREVKGDLGKGLGPRWGR